MDASDGVQAERSRDFERFLTFVDAVVAIAMTLLVLPLVDVTGELGLPGGTTRCCICSRTTGPSSTRSC